MITRENQLFLLDTKDTTYACSILESGHIEHLYYGKKITLTAACNGLNDKVEFIGGNQIAYSQEYSQVGLENLRQEISSYGKGDIREPFVELVHIDGGRTCDFLYRNARIIEKKEGLLSLPASYDETGRTQSLEIEFYDKNYDVTLYVTYSVFYESNVITRSARLLNTSKEPVIVERLMSQQLDLDEEEYIMSTFHGAWAREMEKVDAPCRRGILVNDAKTGTSSNRANPFFMISENGTTEDHGACMGFNLIYSGNHYAAVETNSFGRVRVVQGIHPKDMGFLLQPGESFEAPEAVLTYSDQGYQGMSHNMHHFVKEHIVRGTWKKKERPILINSWEAAYFDFNEGKLLKMAREAKELGIELFVLDDGWFGERNDDTSSLGDWNVNLKKLPNGLRGLSEKIQDMGMSFGIWVEPEMVNENSQLYRMHPDWAVRIPGMEQSLGRNQMILDLTREEVREYVVEQMRGIFTSGRISYVKWDMNRIFSDLYTQGLKPARMKEFSHRYVLGLYQVLDTLTGEFPDILFESCASGGNRFDLGMLCYMPQVWASDNTDAISRAGIQTGYSYGYPFSVMGAHVSGCPNHQTLRDTQIDTRFDVAAFGLLGYECNLEELSTEEKKAVREQILCYKKYRMVLQFGDFYRIKNGDRGIYQWMSVDADKRTAVALYLQKEIQANTGYGRFRAKGLASQKQYRFTNRPVSYNIKEFGSLINMVSPIHIKKDSIAHNLIAKFKRIPSETEDTTAYGDVFVHGGIRLKQAFSGTGYNGETRLFGDFASRMYFFEEVEGDTRS